MTFFNYVSLFGGVALFLYGMSIMGSGLEKVVSGKTEAILQKLTSSTWGGILLGAGITGVIQSSAATTIIVIGLVNSGIMKFSQAIGIIMGANIGTTVTGQIIRLSDINADNFILQLIKPSTLAPIAAMIGAIYYVFLKDVHKRNIGQILLGFGILFTGMMTMENAVVPLRTTPWFISLFTSLQNPILGVLAGIFVTAAIQSSSASVGILQALTSTGLVTYSSAIPIIFGQNIGKTVTTWLASIGTTKNAKKVAYCHIYFNIIGTVVFMALIYGIKLFINFPFWNQQMNMGDVANFHTLFNVASTICFIPYTGFLTRLCEWTVREEKGDEAVQVVLDTRLYNSPSIAIAQAHKAVLTMGEMSKILSDNALTLIKDFDQDLMQKCADEEEKLDRWEIEISNYLVGITNLELTEAEGRAVTTLLYDVGEFERIGDYAHGIIKCATQMRDKQIAFTPIANQELQLLNSAVANAMELTLQALEARDIEKAVSVRPLDNVIAEICESLRQRHIERLKNGLCTVAAGIVFLEVISDYQRIADHCANVVVRLISDEEEILDTHTTIRTLHQQESYHYEKQRDFFAQKYNLTLIQAEEPKVEKSKKLQRSRRLGRKA